MVTSPTPFDYPMAEVTSRKSIAELNTPKRAHQDLALKPRTFHHDCGVRCEGHGISRHWHFNKRHTNAPKSQAAIDDTCIMAMGADVIRAIKTIQYPGHGKSASTLIAANPKGSS